MNDKTNLSNEEIIQMIIKTDELKIKLEQLKGE